MMHSSAPGSGTDLTGLSAVELARRIADGEVSAQEAIEAHIARIETVNPLLNAVVIPLFDQARVASKEADNARARGEPLGPLHGVPMTVKDCFHVAGTASSIGVGHLAEERLPTDGPLIERLRRAGAIILGKTNVPQLMLLHETDNPVFGRTNNPWNLERSPGGSSGGEAAIIAAGGVPWGLGSDLGGSIRQPAHCCGICGLKPTTGRLTNHGARTNLRGMEAIGLQPGPLARRVADLRLALDVLNRAEPQTQCDTAPVPVEWAQRVSLDQLKIGYWTDDDYFAPSPVIRRAVEQAVAALRQSGARVEEFRPPRIHTMMDLYLGIISADGGADFERLLGPSQRDWRIRRLLRLGRLPQSIRPLLAKTLRWGGQSGLAELVSSTGRVSADRYWQLVYARQGYVRQFREAMDQAKIDVLVFPPHALPAPGHGQTLRLPMAASYCFLANLLGTPAGVVPVTLVQPGEETDRPTSRDLVEKAARNVELGSAGLPVGVQVIARHWREDLVLAVMQELETYCSRQVGFPAKPPI